MAAVELRERALIWQIEQLAEQTAQPVETVLATAVEAYLDQLEREGIQAETRAFWSMLDQILEDYSGQHVAIYEGKVVDHDKEASCLEQRVRQHYGSRPVLIAPVKPGGSHEVHWRGGHLETAGAQ